MYRLSGSLFQSSDTTGQFFAVLIILVMLVPTISFASTIHLSSPPSGRLAQKDSPQVAVQSCINGTHTLRPTALRVAFVAPTFTLTPYANFKHSFYEFYVKYMHSDHRITTDLNWLRTRVVVIGNWSSPTVNDEQPLHRFLTSDVASKCGLVIGQNLNVIDDVGVHQGVLFVGTVRQYDVLILGHEEYATRAEYNQFRHFVASGGRIVMMSGNTFWAEVNYTKSTRIETFVAGHGFEFNGAYAWRSTYEPFDKESMGWVASAFAQGTPRMRGAMVNDVSHIGGAIKILFHSDLAFTNYSYPHNEVNYIGNFTNTELIARFYVAHPIGDLTFKMPLLPVDSYAHRYIRGEVVCFCVFGENLILRDPVTQFFLVYATLYGSGMLPVPGCSSPFAGNCWNIGSRAFVIAYLD